MEQQFLFILFSKFYLMVISICLIAYTHLSKFMYYAILLYLDYANEVFKVFDCMYPYP